jgi:SsrA-binding protein
MKILSENKKARFSFDIIEKFEAGIVLTGQEVKSIKSGRINIASSYVTFQDEEAFLVNAKIPPYQPKNAPSDYNPERKRKLLLKKKEIKYLIGKSQEKNLTLIPIKVYIKKRKIKIEFGLARGKKEINKKEQIKKLEEERRIRRILKTRG